MAFTELPSLPARHDELVPYLAAHPDTPMKELMEPYRHYESQLREAYAQERSNPVLNEPYLNVVPLFNENTPEIKTRARNLEAETPDEKQKYIMALPDDRRRPDGSPAVVESLKEFKHNLSVFSESSLVDMDWSNVVAAGSSVVNTLLPVPPKFKKSKRALREYYHEKFCPASDVDLFLYGLNEQQAIEKIKNIEASVRDAILSETTVVRTKNAITIASQYPTRHIQIVLRVYKSVSEILTGFDIDCSGAAYDGKQVYCTPRALASYITQINPVDLSRRSPSYENRLSKYSHRNFEVYWPELDRSRVDPTIFERSFQRTLGLARLLVLERLPTNNAREQYRDKRREERGRPAPRQNFRYQMFGNIKDSHEDEVADWVDEDEVSNYHTFTLPYGAKFNAKKIEKLCYTKDLLLNAEWNQPDEREVYLHRHPAFFGRVQDIIGDCCGTCPPPRTVRETEIAEKESEIYISGNVSFRIDDPGRQQIGSFNPLTEDDWTEMAYVGNTARLCHAIVDGDLEHVEDWLSQEGADPNTRDYTGRTPLQLAVLSSTPEIVKCLVDHGARMVARLADGQTALHLAASRGNLEMIRILLEKSNANEEEEEERKDQLRKAKAAAADNGDTQMTELDSSSNNNQNNDSDNDSDIDMVKETDTDVGVHSVTTGSFVMVDKREEKGTEKDSAVPLDDDKDEPDVYDVNVIAWDSRCSPLHLAILGGHCDAVKLLCQEFGADVLLPVKPSDGSVNAVLTLVLALALPVEKAAAMAETLLTCGATSAQADGNGVTALHNYVHKGNVELVEKLINTDKIGIKAAINHIAVSGGSWNANATGPLMNAMDQNNPIIVLKLLEAGANPEVDFNTWLKGAKLSLQSMRDDLEHNQKLFREGTSQPLILAIESMHPASALEVLERGADPNTISLQGWQVIHNTYYRNSTRGTAALDVTRDLLKKLRRYKGEKAHFNVKVKSRYGYDYWKRLEVDEPPPGPIDARDFLAKFPEGSYQHYTHLIDVERQEFRYQQDLKRYQDELKEIEGKGATLKKEAILDAIKELEKVEAALMAKGAKTFQELYPDIKPPENSNNGDEETVLNKPYSHDIYMRDVENPTSGQLDAYIELFEAAWTGDLEKIKSLTLQPWNGGPPLKVAARDNEDNTPFHLAFYRGHHEVAGAILEIARAQWVPREEEKGRYRMNDDEDEDEDGYEGTDDEDQDVIGLHKEVKPETLTIDNVGEVSMQVKSHVWPTQLVNMNAPTFMTESDGTTRITGDREPMTRVIRENQFKEFKLLLDWDIHYTRIKPSTRDESEKFYVFNNKNFSDAISYGRIDMLTEAIRSCGAGIPLEDLVKKSGTELKVKPRYYQGLTVYGKKRSDWANAGRDLVYKAPPGSRTPPLLIAAEKCSIQSVEWFLSDTPTRCYLEFGSSKTAQEEPQLRHLHSSPGGFDNAIMKWLGTRNDDVIHSVISGPEGDEQHRLLEYLVKVCPAALETKSYAGHTPLFSAVSGRQTSLVKILIDSGADQSVKDKDYNNIVHAALSGNPRLEDLRELLSLFDPGLRTHMFQQRNSLSAGGDTPLHHWLKDSNSAAAQTSSTQDRHNVATLRSILDFPGVLESLESMNSSGDTVLHTAVLRHVPAQAKVLIAANPRLLYRENAVGRTPPEIAHDRYILERASSTTQVFQRYNRFEKSLKDLPSRSVDSFTTGSKDGNDDDGDGDGNNEKSDNQRDSTPTELTWRMLSKCLASAATDQEKQQQRGVDENAPMTGANAAANHIGTKRRLVSLNEANDVARRIGENYSSLRYYPRGGEKEEGDADGEGE